MGLLSSITSKLKAFASNTASGGNIVGKTLNTVSAVFEHPVAFVKNPSQTIVNYTKETGIQSAFQTVKQTAIYTSALLGGNAIAGAVAEKGVVGALSSAGGKVASTIGETFVAHPIATTASVVVGIPTVAGIIAKEPSLVTELPNKAFDAGASLVGAIEEHPTASAIIGGITGGTLLYEGYKALTGNDTTIETNTTTPSQSATPSVATGGLTSSPIATDPSIPKSQETQVIRTGRAKRRKNKPKVPQVENKISIKIDDRDNYNSKIYKGGRR